MKTILILFALLLTSCITNGDYYVVSWEPDTKTCLEKFRYRKPGETADRVSYREVPCPGRGHHWEWMGEKKAPPDTCSPAGNPPCYPDIEPPGRARK